jgi:hypothetical protein
MFSIALGNHSKSVRQADPEQAVDCSVSSCSPRCSAFQNQGRHLATILAAFMLGSWSLGKLAYLD